MWWHKMVPMTDIDMYMYIVNTGCEAAGIYIKDWLFVKHLILLIILDYLHV